MNEAADGDEAIRKIGDSPPQLIVLDLMMPRVNGFDVIRHIQSTNPALLKHTLVVSAYPREAAAQRLHEICDVISKPFDIATFTAAVSRCASAA